MSYPVYSARFMIAKGLNVVTTYTVPAGYRAVVTSLLMSNNAAPFARVWLGVAPSWTYLYVFPESTVTGRSENFRMVAYAGEQVQVYTTAAEVTATASGFLLRDPVGAADDEGVDRRRVELGELLPVGHPDRVKGQG